MVNDFIKKYWKTILFFTAVGLVGGFFTGIYLLDSYTEEIKQQLNDAGIGRIMLGVVAAFQSAGYGLVLGIVGILLGKKIGLWKDERDISLKPLIITVVIAILGGVLLIVPDLMFFSDYSEVIRDSYAVKPTVVYILASVLYGGVIEEVMLRLFTMSLVAFILQKIFMKGSDKPSTAILVIANVLAAILFAAGHLPATIVMIGTSPLIILRCFLLNGTFGLLFGYLYRKYGLRYSMLAHGGCHIVSKLIWILFV